MAISPGTKFKPVSKAYIEQKFDEAWESELRKITPQTHSTLADKALGLPKGSFTITSTFKRNGVTLAITYRHITPQGLTLGNRDRNPTYLLIDGERCYLAPDGHEE